VAERLPGFGAIARRKGRNERIIDVCVRALRDGGRYGAREKALATLARTLGASLDRLEHDPGRSEHTVGHVARVHLQALEALRPNAAPSADAFDRLADELAAAVREPPPT